MTTPLQHTDQSLFALLGEGDEAAFRELFHKYTPVLYPGVVQMVKQPEVAREIVQEVFLKLWLKKEQISLMEQPVGWLFRVASNLAISHLRKLGTQLRWLENMKAMEAPRELDPGDQLSVKELLQLLQEASNALPPQRKMIYKLSREEGLSHEEIASRLQLSKSTVKNQITIASKFIETYISEAIGMYIPLFIFSAGFF